MFGHCFYSRCTLALGLVALMLAAGAPSALADTTLNVSTTADVNPASGVCASGSTTVPSPLSLREATCLANNIGGTATINVPAGTYDLSFGELQPGKHSGQDVNIVGAGSASTIIDGQDLSRVLDYDPSIVGGVTASLSNVTITNGRDGTFGGAGIIAGSGHDATLDTLSVSDSVISNNQANFAVQTVSSKPGGGIEFQGGSLHLTNDTFTGNESFSSDGGAVSYQALGSTTGQTLTVDGSTFSGNSTANSGASGTSGGALAVSAGAGGGTYTVTNSTFINNSASSSGSGEAAAGGAIFEVTGDLTVTGSTFTGNSVSGPGATGGPIIWTAGAATMHYNRFFGNTGTGGVMTNNGSGSADVTENWWGCNAGPNATNCETTSGTGITADPRLVLTASASPSTLTGPDAPSTITASFLTDSAGSAVSSSNLGAFSGLSMGWSDPTPSGATVSSPTSTISSGAATIAYDSHAASGSGHVIAGFDNGTAAASLTVHTPPSITSAASLSGTAADGQPLHLDFEFSSTAGPLTHSYRWERCSDQAMTQNCQTVGNNSRNYTLSHRDVGDYITAEVTATDTNSLSTSSTSPADGPVANPSAPSVVSDAGITGTAQDGQYLHASGYQFSSPDPLAYHYQWQRCSDQAMTQNCSGVGTGHGYYLLTSADVGDYVAVTVTATDREGQTGSSTSQPDGPVANPPAPVNKTAPSITGTTQQGQVLHARKGVWKSPDPLGYRFQWERCASDGTRCTPIRYASHNSYLLTSADAGHQIALHVTATDQENQSTSLTSQPVGPVT